MTPGPKISQCAAGVRLHYMGTRAKCFAPGAAAFINAGRCRNPIYISLGYLEYKRGKKTPSIRAGSVPAASLQSRGRKVPKGEDSGGLQLSAMHSCLLLLHTGSSCPCSRGCGCPQRSQQPCSCVLVPFPRQLFKVFPNPHVGIGSLKCFARRAKAVKRISGNPASQNYPQIVFLALDFAVGDALNQTASFTLCTAPTASCMRASSSAPPCAVSVPQGGF